MPGEQTNCCWLRGHPQHSGTMSEVLSGIFVCKGIPLCVGVPESIPPPEQMQGKASLLSQIASRKVQTERFQPLPLLVPPFPALAPTHWEGEEEDERRGHVGNTKKVLQACLGPRLSPLSHPTPGHSLVIHFHLQSLCMFSAALPSGLAGQILSLWAKYMTECIRVQ